MSRYRAGDGPHPLDVLVGRQLSHRRKLLGLTERDLAEALGFTVHQVRAHEAGTNPIVASQLHEFARLLGVSVGFFFGQWDWMYGVAPDAGAAPTCWPGPASSDRETAPDLGQSIPRIA